MTDIQVIQGIQDNDERVWRYIYLQKRGAFVSTLTSKYDFCRFSPLEWEEIFQQSCIVLMECVKNGRLQTVEGATWFSFFIAVGKNKCREFLRKKHRYDLKESGTIFHDDNPDDEADIWMMPDEKQRVQDEFLDRVLESVPGDCSMIFKKFYWNRMPLEQLAPMFGYKNADTMANKKNKCMNKIREVAERFIAGGEFDEDTVKAAVERAALRELLEGERIRMEQGYRQAALDVDDKEKE